MPPQVIVRGSAEPGLLAHVIVSRFADHNPYNRLTKIYKREGVDIPTPTMVGWVRDCADILKPLAQRLRDLVLADGR